MPISRLEIYATIEAWKMTHGLVSLAGVVGLHGVTSSSPHHNARVGVLVKRVCRSLVLRCQ